MPRRIRATGKALVKPRYTITGGCDTDKNVIVAAVFHADTGNLEAREFHQHRGDAIQAAEWFRSQGVEFVIIESTANYHLLYYDTLRQMGINIGVINPLVVKSLLRVEGKSDKGDAMTLARLAASFDLKTSNMPDNQQRELRLLFKRIDAWKMQRTQITNRANGVLTGCGFTVFRIVPINSSTGFRIIQAVIDGLPPEAIANFHRNKIKRMEIEKSAAVKLPTYILDYLQEVLADVRSLNERITKGEAELLAKIPAYGLAEQVALMCTVPCVTKMLSLRIIAEMGANFHQRYYSAEAFAKGIGVVPNNEVSGGKLLKRKASYGNKRVKFHLLSAAKVFAIHGKGPMRTWFDAYRGRAKYRKAVSAMARRIAEGLWWVMVRHEPYKYWQGEPPAPETEVIQMGSHIIDAATGEVLETISLPDLAPDNSIGKVLRSRKTIVERSGD
jgi:transposase